MIRVIGALSLGGRRRAPGLARSLVVRLRLRLRLRCLAGTHEWAFHRRGARPKRVAVDGAVHTTSPTLAARLAAGGLGIARLVEWVIREELWRGELVEVMKDWSCDDPAEGGIPVYVVYAQTASATPPLKSRVFVELVKDVMAREVLAPLGRRR